MRRTHRHKTIFYKEIRAICCWSYRWAYPWIAITLIACIPAFLEARDLQLDTNLTRLLPEDSDAVHWSRELEPIVGDGGYFSVILEGDDREVLQRASDAAANRLAALPGIDSVMHRYPVEFLRRHRYALIPQEYLREMVGVVAGWEAAVNPFLEDLTDDDGEDEESELERLVRLYGAELPEYHEDPTGRLLGMLVYPADGGLNDLGALQSIHAEIARVADEIAAEYGVWTGIGGSLRTRVDEFEVIVSDLTRSGLVALVAILLTLAVSFRSVRVLPIVIYPLAAGLIWSFALVPTLVGDLNTITSFLLMVLFGMGADYSIHLVKRFRSELAVHAPDEALIETFTSTGRSVMTSGTTTAFGLSILALSDFRGFSDFGWIGGTSILIVMLSMLLVMPACLIVGYRLGLVRPRVPDLPSRHLAIPPKWAAGTLVVLVVASAGASARWLRFDYDFSEVSAVVEEAEIVKAKQDEVYPVFFGPGAVYVAQDLGTLDATLDALQSSKAHQGSVIGPISSVRDFAPNEVDRRGRLELIGELQDMLSGRWVRRIEDQDRLEVIDDLLRYTPPQERVTVDGLPDSIVRNLVARDGSAAMVIALNPDGNTKDGRLTMEFARELDALDLPTDLRGPTGDKIVLAEVLFLVTSEAPMIILLTIAGIFLLVVLDRRSVYQAVWVLVPLGAGLLLTFGAMLALGQRLNFFNMVVLPALLGIGVDHGVHYYRRWRELHRDTSTTQRELFEPISVASLTTIMGYAGMALAHHPGLRSIGILAVIGLVCTWVTALVLLPGLLGWRKTHMHARAHAGEVARDAG